MRGTSDQQIESLVALTPEDLVPHGHPIRRIKPLADRVLQELSPTFSRMYAKEAGPPKSQWRSIKARYDALIDGWQAKMDLDSWFRGEMSVAEERILQGEQPEVVLQNLRNRFEEKYGEAKDATGDGTPSAT